VTTYGSREGAIPPPPRPIEYRDVDAGSWWRSLLLGVLLVGLGLWILTNLYESVVVLAWLVGASLIVGGVVEAVALGGRQSLGWVGGAVSVLAGVAVLAWPDITLRVLALVVGLTLVVGGSLRLVTALYNRDRPGWALDLGLGGMALATGAIILAWPEATLLVIAVVFGIRAIGTGLVAIGIGWQLHHLA
jgi:uncharacterized membrane protein HdeD (DUF308 family)